MMGASPAGLLDAWKVSSKGMLPELDLVDVGQPSS
jgi:hypothetical protein